MGVSGPNPAMMALAIFLSLVLIIIMYWIGKKNRQAPDFSEVVKAMVGGPDILNLISTDREGALSEIAEHASKILRWPDHATILRGLMRREEQMPTGLVHGIAIPHARFVKLGRSLVVFARSETGIEWDCVDGLPAHSIFMLLTPEEDEHTQLKMLAEISRCADNEECRKVFQTANDCRDITRALSQIVKR